jgi:hypothetical protein
MLGDVVSSSATATTFTEGKTMWLGHLAGGAGTDAPALGTRLSPPHGYASVPALPTAVSRVGVSAEAYLPRKT